MARRTPRTPSSTAAEAFDVCIVGAGAAGCYLARRLADSGVSVVLVEAGDFAPATHDAAGFDVAFVDREYSGATSGRYFGVGGSTTNWGGHLIPHSRADERIGAQNDPYGDVWPVIVEACRLHGAEVLRVLGRRQDAEFTGFAGRKLEPSIHDALRRADFEVLAGLYLPFRRKNLSWLLRGHRRGGRIALMSNAVATSWMVGTDGHVSHLSVTRLDSARSLIEARRFVVAAGAIESARVLLEIAEATPDPVSLSPEIGKNLGDHLSLPIARVHPADLAVAGKLRPVFEHGWMRSFRYVWSGDGVDVARHFAHLVFEDKGAGFRLAKDLLGAAQRRQLPKLKLTDVASGVAGATRLAAVRVFSSALHVPADAGVLLQLDVEQAAPTGNRIRLGEERDGYGRPVPEIEWSLSGEDRTRITALARSIIHGWQGQSSLPRLIPLPVDGGGDKVHDAYHPVGVCRMGPAGDGVVGTDLSVHGLSNVSLLSTGVLPSAGTANPTFTLLCLAEALAIDLADSTTHSKRPGGNDVQDGGSRA